MHSKTAPPSLPAIGGPPLPGQNRAHSRTGLWRERSPSTKYPLSCWPQFPAPGTQMPSPGQTLAWGRLNPRVGTDNSELKHEMAGGGPGQHRSFRHSPIPHHRSALRQQWGDICRHLPESPGVGVGKATLKKGQQQQKKPSYDARLLPNTGRHSGKSDDCHLPA